MHRHSKSKTAPLRDRMQSVLLSPALLAFLPAATLAAYWVGGELALMAVALAIPLARGKA